MADRALHRPPNGMACNLRLAILALAVLCLIGGRAAAAPFAAVVMDARTGEILHAVNHNAQLHPASLTKMMTLYVAFEAITNGEISLDTMVRISRRAAAEPPSRLGLREGQRIALRHLIRAAALRSGNDAATAIAEAVSGSVEAFAQRMNRTAAAMGMTQTRFRNAHGLTQAGHMSSARDMTILGRHLYYDYPQYYALFSRRVEDAGVTQVGNTNSRFLDGYRGADGIKTGFTSAAGYNLTAMAERDGVRILVTVFGGRSIQHRHDMVVQLMDRGFREAPARVAVRRPARPNYARAETRTARATARAEAAEATGAARVPQGTAPPQTGRAAGRVIRLQTAPGRSIFPRPRPGAAAPVLTAALQSGIESAVAQAAAPSSPAAPAEAQPPAPADRSPARSPRPPGRPEAVLARAAPSAPVPDPVAEDIAVARAAGFDVISAEELERAAEIAAALAAEPAADPDSAVAALAQTAAGAPAGALPDAAARAPAMRPSTLPATDAPAEASASDTATGEALASAPRTDGPVGTDTLDLAAIDPDPARPDAEAAEAGLPVGSEPLEFSPADLAAVEVRGDAVVIPGLPPIPLTAPVVAPDHAPVAAAGAPALTDPPASTRAPEPALVVTAEGRILWGDDDILEALDAVVAEVLGPSPILLTTEETVDLPPPPAMPQIVTRVSTSGGQLWAVDLGRYTSRFDAERTLLRVALAESSALGGGVRRVVESGGRHQALVASLTQDQASLACRRLQAIAQPCEVIPP